MNIICKKCGCEKNEGKPCRSCINKANREYKLRNAEKVKAARSEYKKRKWAEGAADRAEKKRIRDESRSLRRKVARDKWKKNNRHMVAANCAERFARKMFATPFWANREKISEIYKLADKLEADLSKFGMTVKFHVDHIVPLRSKLVCGLHTEDNLRVVPDFVNMAKGNRDWPDMASHDQNWVQVETMPFITWMDTR